MPYYEQAKKAVEEMKLEQKEVVTMTHSTPHCDCFMCREETPRKGAGS